MLPTFDIFFGKFSEPDTLRLDALESFEEAYQKMLLLAADKPGPYFIFSGREQTCVADIDTTPV
jgi:hypothetical protein